MLGPSFQYKGLLSPVIKIHLFRTYTSIHSEWIIKLFTKHKYMIEPLTGLQRKTLMDILNLSKYASTPATYFFIARITN